MMFFSRCRDIGLTMSLLSIVMAGYALAQEDQQAAKRPEVTKTAPLSSNSTVNLINLLVQQNVLTSDQAEVLIKQAEQEAYIARQAAKDATARAQTAETKADAAALAASPPGTKRVTYVPEIVKKQLREEIKNEVMAKAEKENWASPGKYPEWAQRIQFYGDMRLRDENQFLSKSNGPLQDFNAINTGSPFQEPNANGDSPYYPPHFNTTENRNRFRVRARLGANITLTDAFSAGLRIGTGESNSPVGLNQTLGANGGNFSKYPIWLDRAFLKYQPVTDITAIAGRFDNPFWAPTDLVWANELGFDGAALTAKREITSGFTPFATAGAFPIFNTPSNAGLNFQNQAGPISLHSDNKWLLGGQIGAAGKLQESITLTGAVSYYNFMNINGQLSSSCPVATAADICDTDLRRPSFAQKGNTYMWLRNIPTISTTNLTTFNYQYYGLASSFQPVNVSAQLDLAQLDPVHVILDGDYVNNVAYNKSKIAAIAVNNTGATSDGSVGAYQGGNQGWLARLTVGNKEIKKLWDWKTWVGYKYLESDAMVDAYVDSDFGLGGTNLKGYFIGASLGLGNNVWATTRWMSANKIAGAPYSVDVFQLDLNARF